MDLPAVRSEQSLYHSTNKLMIYETNKFFDSMSMYLNANQQNNFGHANVIKTVLCIIFALVIFQYFFSLFEVKVQLFGEGHKNWQKFRYLNTRTLL